MMKHWEDMNEEEKSEFCRHSGCPYYYGGLDDCMADEVDNYNPKEAVCRSLKKEGVKRCLNT